MAQSEQSHAIKIAGNVGINQTSPTSMLHIGGSSANADSLALRVQDSDGNCAFNPESTDTAWTCSSDIRLKENIKDYTVIASGDNKTGVIAQEIIEKYPELVHKDNDGYYMVDGINTWKLVKAIQELKAENDALKELVCLDHPDAEVCKI